ncbi:hypothetical protein ACFPOU_23470 [Massilia jejuensis]|uniref:EAL domain-containing protein n=1 Tax=Massilia jejuensis TaxID=648894 RepID=A0ABW0PNM4_9BURK
METLEQLDFLRTRCCEMYQGFLFGKPIPLREFEAQLQLQVPEASA